MLMLNKNEIIEILKEAMNFRGDYHLISCYYLSENLYNALVEYIEFNHPYMPIERVKSNIEKLRYKGKIVLPLDHGFSHWVFVKTTDENYHLYDIKTGEDYVLNEVEFLKITLYE